VLIGGLVLLAAVLTAAGLLANHQARVPVPTITYNPKTSCSGTVTITDDDRAAGAAIQVTLDGGDPINTGWSYKHPFTAYANVIIKARDHNPVNGFSPVAERTITCSKAASI
jgi:hypothetical protein